MNPDAVIIAYIAVFLLAKAILIRKLTWLGRSLGVCNLMLAIIFGYGALKTQWPRLADYHVLLACRIGVCGGVTWAAAELYRVARDRWRLLP